MNDLLEAYLFRPLEASGGQRRLLVGLELPILSSRQQILSRPPLWCVALAPSCVFFLVLVMNEKSLQHWRNIEACTNSTILVPLSSASARRSRDSFVVRRLSRAHQPRGKQRRRFLSSSRRVFFSARELCWIDLSASRSRSSADFCSLHYLHFECCNTGASPNNRRCSSRSTGDTYR